MPPKAADLALFTVERRMDLGDLLGLARFVRDGLVGAGLAAEIEVEYSDAVAAVRADLLQRREELLLGLRAHVRGRRDLVGRSDFDHPVALQARGRRDQLPDDHVLLES